MTSDLRNDIRLAIQVQTQPHIVDPWRIYQETSLITRLCEECCTHLPPDPIDIFAGVSDLGFPLAILLAMEYNRRTKRTAIPVISVSDGEQISGSWWRPGIPMNSKSVILCDDLLAGGGHMWRCIERLDNEGASCVGAVVILDNDAVINRDKVDLVKQRLKERLISIISVRQK